MMGTGIDWSIKLCLFDLYVGYLDLKLRSLDIATSFDLVSGWLVPNKDDLTYYNFKTNTSRNNSTRVRVRPRLQSRAFFTKLEIN